MSYPDKEKRIDNQSEKVENRPKELNRKKSNPSLKELNKEQEDRLPIGKLKWSKEDEENLNTQLNLGNDKQDTSPASKMNEGNIEKNSTQKAQDQVAAGQSEKEPSYSLSDDENNEDLKKRPLSLEDTLSPIHFKQYQIEPNQTADTSTDTGATKSTIDSTMPRLDLGDVDRDRHDSSDEDPSSKRKRIAKTAFKILWLPLLLIIVLIVGLMFGHSFGGESAMDVFDLDMWEHIYDLIYSK